MGDEPLTTERAYWVAWAQAKGMGPVLLKRLHSHFGSLATAWQAEESALLEVEGIGLLLAAQMSEHRQRTNPDDVLSHHEEQGANFWTPADPDYPALLYEITDPPPLLYYKGRTELAQAVQTMPSVAMVGTREPSAYGQRWTRRIVQQLASHDVIVVSGLASGIDRYAHSQALDSKGLTIAVLGTGVDHSYPWENRALQARIAKEGLLLSEHPNNTPPDRTHFPRRNRIIAGLSRATVVTEAPLRSGALITARLANDYGREVYALPGSLDSPSSLGCLDLIRQGAQMIWDDTTLIRDLGQIPQLDAPPLSAQSATALTAPKSANPQVLPVPTAAPADLPSDLATVLAAVTTAPITLDYLVQTLNRPTGDILSSLLHLELEGLVTQTPPGSHRYQRC
ncbi:DNA repair protein Smf [Leptolyngbya sp. BL0902]|uniref:DNA-processing protein DprA n=1 Tax=Leptolyngbya sp. BL0902 TaxID=1115757 RepID=UPI0018E8CA43|nr:DNA-processing protein DprA [Leptolyngbya sp. BL0902]QQE67186.1 DNA repair protein Smf [Leptolyngbya sp. BL0902]